MSNIVTLLIDMQAWVTYIIEVFADLNYHNLKSYKDQYFAFEEYKYIYL